jgi:hypothetical protein
MDYFRMPTKLVKLVSATMEGAKACVQIQNDLTDHFEVNRELKQGGRLASLLVSIALEYAVRQLPVDVNSSLIYKSDEIVGYVDDVNIMGRFMQTVEERCRELEEHTKTIGLMNANMKTKVMMRSRRDSRHQQIEIQDVEPVNSFTYVGTELTR